MDGESSPRDEDFLLLSGKLTIHSLGKRERIAEGSLSQESLIRDLRVWFSAKPLLDREMKIIEMRI